jgi:hypothetical protein
MHALMCLATDNCLLEVQLAQRLLELKAEFGKTADIKDLGWKSKLMNKVHMNKVHPENPKTKNMQAAEAKKRASVSSDKMVAPSVNFGDLEMIFPLFLGRQDIHGNLGNFFAPNCYRLFGQFPAGVSRVTSSRCQDHLRQLIKQHSAGYREDNQEKSLDTDSQQDPVGLEKPAVIALTVDKQIKNRPHDIERFKREVIAQVQDILKLEVKAGANAPFQVLFVKQGREQTTATVVLLGDKNLGLGPLSLAQRLYDSASKENPYFSQAELLGSIDNAVASMMQQINSGRFLSCALLLV